MLPMKSIDSFISGLSEPMFTYSNLFSRSNNINQKIGVEFDENEVRIDVPGFNKDTLEVYFDEGYVIVKGKSDTRNLNKKVYIGNIDVSECYIKDGLLTVKLFQKQKSTKVPIEEK